MCDSKVRGQTEKVKLVDYSKKDKPWDNHKYESEIITNFYSSETSTKKRALRMMFCAGSLGFAWDINEQTGEAKLKLQKAQFCRVRHCPVCEWRRSLMWRARFYQALPALQEQYPKYRFLFLTLTVRNCKVTELRQTIQEMNKAWRKLINRNPFKIVKGFVRATEVTKSDDGTAHPHFHCILMVPPSYFTTGYIKAEKWQSMWRESLQVDYLPITNIKPIKNLSKGILETMKYSVKPNDLIKDKDWFLEFAKQVHRLRFIATGGLLKDVLKKHNLEDMTDNDLIHLKDSEDSGKNPDLYFDWNTKSKHYEQRD